MFSTVSASAQTHPCDQPVQTSGTWVEGSATLGWCETGKDLNGNVTTVTSRKVYVDGAAFTVTGQAAGSPSTKGETFYTTGVMLVRGTHNYELTEFNAQGESSKSAPFVLAVTPPLTVPPAPVIKSVRQP